MPHSMCIDAHIDVATDNLARALVDSTRWWASWVRTWANVIFSIFPGVSASA